FRCYRRLNDDTFKFPNFVTFNTGFVGNVPCRDAYQCATSSGQVGIEYVLNSHNDPHLLINSDQDLYFSFARIAKLPQALIYYVIISMTELINWRTFNFPDRTSSMASLCTLA